MRSSSAGRVVILVDPSRKIIIIRPIGDLTGDAFIGQLFDAYAKVDSPWTYSRLNDFRRFEGYLTDDHLMEIARRWRELAGGRDYHAYVAVVSFDPIAPLRVPAVSPMFPNESICLFTDYYEAIGWLLADDKTSFLLKLPPLVHIPLKGNEIVFE